ncbi:MAG: type II toxin-antitoxin system HipA family toxin [Xanthomonadales bacterium]|nr:type II toxin-antitoxin system HipA family toxin [Xanthomonadales bacterium]
MSRTLDVYLNRDLAGHLIQDDDGQMVFGYVHTWLTHPEAVPLSISLPLRKEQFTQRECRGFFGGILPEAGNRKVIARILQISEKNDFAMLEQIGGECAGAITFVPDGASLPEPADDYREISDEELTDILRTLPKRPLLAGEKGVRLSLAGAQDKIAVCVDHAGKIFLPLNYAPSTHVLKPASAIWKGLVGNEAYCMALADAVGIPAAKTTMHQVGDIEYLLSERYDRVVGGNGNIQRLHQEDFCQALGIASDNKYQDEGGPGLKECFALLRVTSSNAVKDLMVLLEAVTFNLLIGNNDAHAKNFSFLYLPDGSRRLAPLYDLVCTVFYPEIVNKLAMKIGGEANPELVFPGEFEKFAKDTGLAPALVKRRIPEFAHAVLDAATRIKASGEVVDKVADLIAKRCESVISRFKRS